MLKDCKDRYLSVRDARPVTAISAALIKEIDISEKDELLFNVTEEYVSNDETNKQYRYHDYGYENISSADIAPVCYAIGEKLMKYIKEDSSVFDCCMVERRVYGFTRGQYYKIIIVKNKKYKSW